MTTKMGRPKLPKAQTKGVLIGARFLPDEAKRIHQAAGIARQNRSVWVRNALISAAKSSVSQL